MQQKTTQLHWLFSHWYYTLAISAFVLMLAALALQALTPKPEKVVPDAISAKPGDTFSVKKLGEPLESFTTENNETGYRYASDFAAYPNEVVVDAENTIQFVKEFITFDPDHTLAQYAEQYGQPDLELFDSNSPDSVRAHVFLTAGLVVVAHIDGDVVEQKWYFIPTTEELFLVGFGNPLSESGSGPEARPE